MAAVALPTWDETIVPALRKRLESESRILAKRMSVASISSPDDPLALAHPQVHLPEPRKSSAIPRPSLQYSRSPSDHRTDPSVSYTRPGGPPQPPNRARTYSQPPSPDAFSANPLPTPESSRPTSPRTSDVKPTRIPVAARARTTSTSSHAHSIALRADGRTTAVHRPYHPPTPDTSQDHWVVKASEPPQPTTPPTASIRHHPSSIMNEPAPFATSSITSQLRSRIQEPVHLNPRPSNDSEERPFEHWYRGDVHRNGGVGELRVAKHVEMLQIANYGHNLRKAVNAQTSDSSGQHEPTRGRKRADSVGAGTRESIYLDDDRTKDVDMVLDESPLTDIEADPDTDPETFYDAYAGVDAQPDADDTIHSGPGPSIVPSGRSQTPTNPTPLPNGTVTTPKHIAYVQPPSDPLRSGTPSVPPRTSTESTMPTPPTSGPHKRSMSSTTSPPSQSSDQSHTKRRAKSPVAASPASTPKKARTRARTTPPTSRDPRNSVAVYPTPEGDIVNAIPTWTQPVQKSGNWDEVVLPVVARKKGLDGLYEEVGGSPKPRSTDSMPIKPAPGTFGYDYTKYRPPRLDEVIQMGEFGLIPEHDPLPEESQVLPNRLGTLPKPRLPPPIDLEQPTRPDAQYIVPNPPESPAPFSQYRVDHQVPTINVTRPSSEFVEQQRQEQEYEDVTGGCCKCVVM